MSKNTAPAIVLSTDDQTAAALVATIRSAVNGAGKYAAYVEAHQVTRENVKDHARALAVLAYPNDAPIQRKNGARTRFGNAVQAAGNGLRAALGKAEAKPTDYLARVAKSVEAAVKHGHDADAILAAVTAALGDKAGALAA